ncbi:hypothetical protein V6Z11_D13G222800 [Gossypium hirsutum]
MSYSLHWVCTNLMSVDFGSFKPPILLGLKLMFGGITKFNPLFVQILFCVRMELCEWS